MLRVELPQSTRRSEAHEPESVQEDGSFIDTVISLLCGIVCNNEQYNKSVGKGLLLIKYNCGVTQRGILTIL